MRRYGRQQEVQVDERLCARACEQVSSRKGITSEDVQCIVEKVAGLIMVMTSAKMQSTNENLQRVAKM